MIVQLSRFVLATFGALAGLAVKDSIDWTGQIGFPESLVIILFVILGCSIGFILGGILGRELTRAYIYVEEYTGRMSASDLLLATAGLLVGLVVALITSQPIRDVQPGWIAIGGTVTLFVILGYYGVRVAMIKRREFARLLPRLGDPSGEQVAAPCKILDTSAVIDGRFAVLLRTGFLDGSLRVPGFVLAELQTLADSADDGKRARGRRGLDLLATLNGVSNTIQVFEADYPEMPEVDAKLVRLARDLGAELVTVDYNLAQVARVQSVKVLNINELAAALRPSHLPGEQMRISVLREGKEADQGVGYLEDGTMVVVQNGRAHIGSELDTVVTSVLQTSAGRMVFARPTGA
jgi:uncharacterized protein YacL